MVDDVGAKLFGQASFSTVVSITKSASLDKKEFRFPQSAIILFPSLRTTETNCLISSVLPLLEIQITRSSF